MYKLFLCLRYLRKRVLAYFAVLAVALCVAMMLIVVSVMNGFLRKIEVAAKGLFGDIVVEGPSVQGVARYDEFIEDVLASVPEVQAGSPFIYGMGFIRVPGDNRDQPVQIAGIRLPQRAQVSDFAAGLHFQQGRAPTFDPPLQWLAGSVQQETRRIEDMLQRARSNAGKPAPDEAMLARLRSAVGFQMQGRWRLERAIEEQQLLARLAEQVEQARRNGAPQAEIAQLEDLLQRLQDRPPEQLPVQGPEHRAILGRSTLNFRTRDGEVVRDAGSPGLPVVLTLFPLGRQTHGMVGAGPVTVTFTVVDDSRTDVSSIDSNIVYVPFDTLQQLNGMGPQELAEFPGQFTPGRASQVHFKVKPGYANAGRLEDVSARIQGRWEEFWRRHGDVPRFVSVQTWRQRQAPLISQIASQRTLVVIMFGVISLVAVVLVFVLFYTIVMQKTRDIGVMKALGASGGGVAQIFLGYGAAVGLAGSAIGSVIGYVFVRNINPIHDWVGRTFGFQVWTREWFMFDRIPSDVEPAATAVIVLGAIASGVLGALLPAALAGRMQPVEALRYE